MRLHRRIRQLCATRAALLDRLRLAAPAHLLARPRPDGWSILEILEHLVLAEQAVLQDWPDFAELTGKERTLGNRLRYLLVMLVLKARIRVRVPSRKMVPVGGQTFAELEERWKKSEAWLQAYVAQLDANGLQKAVFRHPVAGPVTVAQAIRMNLVHVRIHRRQIDALLRMQTGKT
jgi:hypothetical protein